MNYFFCMKVTVNRGKVSFINSIMQYDLHEYGSMHVCNGIIVTSQIINYCS